MKLLALEREASTDSETMGRLTYGHNGETVTLHTVEQEWRPTAPGGEPNNSCVPAGRYKLIHHLRPNGRRCLALVNPGLGVYYRASERPNGVGRFLILIHSGNTHHDVVGCIAPGTGRSENTVTRSRDAMEAIMSYVDDDPDAELVII